ncbi:MAG: DUF808 domain-containing protein [Bdellovibrio sp.]|nr:DUF808 domain-containing protein [Bdellovibrio sp.]
MALSSLLTLIDDIATTLDDVAIMTKIAAKKTTAVLGDDLAVNAQQVMGVNPDREIPIILAVARGSAFNKVILIPASLAISFFIPWLVTPLLILGGTFLCYEAFEKILEKFYHRKSEQNFVPTEAANVVSPAFLEKQKIKGAIKTDFILSAEIIIITLGTVSMAPFMKQLSVLMAVSLLMTLGVYGIVIIIIKLDDLGFYLKERPQAILQNLGGHILLATPHFMKLLGVVGTGAMFLVGGGIVNHGIPWFHHNGMGLNPFLATLLNFVTGFLLGGIAVLTLACCRRVWMRCFGKHLFKA